MGCEDVGTNSTNSQDIEIFAYYNDHLYKEADDWHILGKITEKVSPWVGYVEKIPSLGSVKDNDKIMLHENDPDNLFISYDSVIDQVHVLRKNIAPLPKVYSSEVEKMVLSDGDTNSAVTLEGDVLLAFCAFLKQFYTGTDLKNNIPQEKKPDDRHSMNISVYFKGYPAYLAYGEINITVSGNIVLFADYDKREDELIKQQTI